MRMALQGDLLRIRDADNAQIAVIKSWHKMTRVKREFQGSADLELLDKLSRIVRLPPDIETRRLRLQTDAVDRERMDENPKPLAHYPVKMQLYRHQTRAANMCLLTFGWAYQTEEGTGYENTNPDC